MSASATSVVCLVRSSSQQSSFTHPVVRSLNIKLIRLTAQHRQFSRFSLGRVSFSIPAQTAPANILAFSLFALKNLIVTLSMLIQVRLVLLVYC